MTFTASNTAQLVCALTAVTALSTKIACAQETTPQPSYEKTLETLQSDIENQARRLDELQRELALARAKYSTLTLRVQGAELDKYRGAGKTAKSSDILQKNGNQTAQDSTDYSAGLSNNRTSNSMKSDVASDDFYRSNGEDFSQNRNVDKTSTVLAQATVNQDANANSSERTPKQLQTPQIFDQPGILTQKNHVVVEPSMQYGYASNNRVALVGYTVIPALLIGLVDVREVKRNTVTAAVSARYGVTNRFEVEAKIPYVYRSDSTVSREIFTGASTERAFDTSGKSIGDIELGARYQLNDGGVDKPYFIGTMRFKSRTGKDPFSTITDCVTRCIGNTTGTGLPLELPTGSGFYSLQPGLTWLFPSDPAIFFGSFTYTHNFKRNNVSRTVLNGQKEPLGSIAAGDVLGANFGMGLALNDKTSLSMGIDLNSIGRTKQNNVAVPGSVRTQLATLLFGYSYRVSDKVTLSLAVGGGLTRDTPDLTLNLKMPISF